MTGLIGRIRAHREARAEAPTNREIDDYLTAARGGPLSPRPPYSPDAATQQAAWRAQMAEALAPEVTH
ncbi:hypothetical protein [Sphaerisporangium aureirubrum]|uniref:Uncharacterized protein n=1 Tax=Sphaerisporangium aureirubrum TaxID=1544736 RepID=A0ABW1NCQ0_9ACTN